mmetsp:Transcript_10994/g.29792  ORF Transcript_10994/g.29792 Transcript_10994/m.29792 type:complete len:340 (-) Transcript_10994:705-1724(-)
MRRAGRALCLFLHGADVRAPGAARHVDPLRQPRGHVCRDDHRLRLGRRCAGRHLPAPLPPQLLVRVGRAITHPVCRSGAQGGHHSAQGLPGGEEASLWRHGGGRGVDHLLDVDLCGLADGQCQRPRVDLPLPLLLLDHPGDQERGARHCLGHRGHVVLPRRPGPRGRRLGGAPARGHHVLWLGVSRLALRGHHQNRACPRAHGAAGERGRLPGAVLLHVRGLPARLSRSGGAVLQPLRLHQGGPVRTILHDGCQGGLGDDLQQGPGRHRQRRPHRQRALLRVPHWGRTRRPCRCHHREYPGARTGHGHRLGGLPRGLHDCPAGHRTCRVGHGNHICVLC